MDVVITGQHLTAEAVWNAAVEGASVKLGFQVRDRVSAARSLVERASASTTVYGIHTGVGELSELEVTGDDRDQQLRLLRSHACGVGEPFDDAIVRGALVLKANAIASGASGVREVVLEQLLAFLERGVVPVVPCRGSVGASGDLAPLAHLALPLVGEGEAFVARERLSGAAALERAGLQPLELAAKEALSLINGTQFMTAQLALLLVASHRLATTADVACAQTVAGLGGSADPYLAVIHALRPHPGQIASAETILRLVGLHTPDDGRLQEAYSLRCAPQVHGAVRDLLDYCARVLSVELNAATDNPLVLVDEGAVVSNTGNFHGQPLAFALDALAIAVAELASISERRLERLLNPTLSGLPPFLATNPGLDSGLMIAQYVAAALVSENKILCHPASVDSIPTSAGQEDHVSMGNTAALKARQVVANTRVVLAIELIAGAQALEHRDLALVSPAVRAIYDTVRATVPQLEDDRALSAEIEALTGRIAAGAVSDLA